MPIETSSFEAYPKTPRLFREVVVTEKLDGTNAQIFITEEGTVHAGSRNRWVSPADDNYGFARWVEGNREELLKLGPGRHFGEWWGQGIQRGYGLTEKRFSLFNASRWGQGTTGVFELSSGTPPAGPACCHVVPILTTHTVFCTTDIEMILLNLRHNGSVAAPGFKNPEGIIVYHTAAKQSFKVLLENDAEPKGKTNS